MTFYDPSIRFGGVETDYFMQLVGYEIDKTTIPSWNGGLIVNFYSDDGERVFVGITEE